MGPIKTAMLVMDDYKAPTLRKNLKSAGFTWTEFPCSTVGAMIFQIDLGSECFYDLYKVVRLSNIAALGRN